MTLSQWLSKAEAVQAPGASPGPAPPELWLFVSAGGGGAGVGKAGLRPGRAQSVLPRKEGCTLRWFPGRFQLLSLFASGRAA